MPRETAEGAPGQTRMEISFWGHWRQRRGNSWKARGEPNAFDAPRGRRLTRHFPILPSLKMERVLNN